MYVMAIIMATCNNVIMTNMYVCMYNVCICNIMYVMAIISYVWHNNNNGNNNGNGNNNSIVMALNSNVICGMYVCIMQ
jgi:hypothetical protein